MAAGSLDPSALAWVSDLASSGTRRAPRSRIGSPDAVCRFGSCSTALAAASQPASAELVQTRWRDSGAVGSISHSEAIRSKIGALSRLSASTSSHVDSVADGGSALGGFEDRGFGIARGEVGQRIPALLPARVLRLRRPAPGR